MHFEQGLKLETFRDLDFEGENGHYTMTQFIQYKRNPDHFTCWTREPKGTVRSSSKYDQALGLTIVGLFVTGATFQTKPSCLCFVGSTLWLKFCVTS